MIRCRTCCYPSTKPDLVFDTSGRCSACLSHARRPTINWEERLRELHSLLDRFDGRVLVPSSGGKDSTYIALRMKEMGADVTAMTATTCHLTPTGRANLDNLACHVRTIEVTPNMTTRAKLNRLALRLVGDISWPEHATIFSVPFRVASQLGGNRLLMYGENPQAEYGGPMGSESAKEMTRRWVSEFGGFNGLRPTDFVGKEGITERDMADYRFPSFADLEGVEAHFLGAYEPWDSHRNAKVAEEAGMRGLPSYAAGHRWEPPSKANYWPLENLDNAQTGIHDHLMYCKYGFGRGCSQISVDVRNREITRDDALQWLARHDGIFPNFYAGVYLEDTLERIGMDRAELLEICERFSGAHLR